MLKFIAEMDRKKVMTVCCCCASWIFHAATHHRASRSNLHNWKNMQHKNLGAVLCLCDQRPMAPPDFPHGSNYREIKHFGGKFVLLMCCSCVVLRTVMSKRRLIRPMLCCLWRWLISFVRPSPGMFLRGESSSCFALLLLNSTAQLWSCKNRL